MAPKNNQLIFDNESADFRPQGELIKSQKKREAMQIIICFVYGLFFTKAFLYNKRL